MNNIDIILIKPGSQKQLYGELSEFKLTAIEPPFWGALLAAYLIKLGYSTILIDAEVENWDYEKTAQIVADENPTLAAVIVSGTNPSASTMNMTGAGKIARNIHNLNPNIKTLLAGLHPSALPEQTLIEEQPDFVCQGEGFYTLPALIDALKNSEDKFPIKGLWYLDNNNVTQNPRPEIIKSLEQLPIPAWDLLPMKKYRAHNWHCFDNITNRQPYAVLYTSLGCPFNCSFCCINSLFGKNIIRYRPLDSVIKEIDLLINQYGIRNIKIMDEMFALNEKRIVALCNMIIERGYELNMWAYARVNTVTKKMLSKMKQAGINWVSYGFESGNKRVIKHVDKGYKTDQVMDVVKMTNDLDINICANYIFGLPEDDFDSMNDTLKLMLDINAEWANIYCAMAYPGSQLYEFANQNKWLLPKTWQDYSQYSYATLPLPTKYLNSEEVLAFRDYAFHAYYENPAYLNMIEKKFGHSTTNNIIQTTSKKLKRKFSKY